MKCFIGRYAVSDGFAAYSFMSWLGAGYAFQAITAGGSGSGQTVR